VKETTGFHISGETVLSLSSSLMRAILRALDLMISDVLIIDLPLSSRLAASASSAGSSDFKAVSWRSLR
jgi:hypothetical protein